MNTETLREILLFIDKHIYEKISLAELARIAGYSPFHFSKLFSESMGMPVTGYIRIRKLQYAICSLLEGKKVLDVSFLYAFDSHEGFTRSFTKLFGSTPSTVRKYLVSYTVPEYVVPETAERRADMRNIAETNRTQKDSISNSLQRENTTLQRDMHQLVFEVLKASLEEAKEGYCTEINIALLEENRIQIADNGRGIPLSKDAYLNKSTLDKILAGHPITNLEYAGMGDFEDCGLQTVNSLCESLQVTVYRDGIRYRQDYIRGIAQHELECAEMEHPSGMEILMKPDGQIFGDIKCSMGMIKDWVEKRLDGYSGLIIRFQENISLQ